MIRQFSVNSGADHYPSMIMRDEITYYSALVHIPLKARDRLPQEYLALLKPSV